MYQILHSVSRTVIDRFRWYTLWNISRCTSISLMTPWLRSWSATIYLTILPFVSPFRFAMRLRSRTTSNKNNWDTYSSHFLWLDWRTRLGFHRIALIFWTIQYSVSSPSLTGYGFLKDPFLRGFFWLAQRLHHFWIE